MYICMSDCLLLLWLVSTNSIRVIRVNAKPTNYTFRTSVMLIVTQTYAHTTQNTRSYVSIFAMVCCGVKCECMYLMCDRVSGWYVENVGWWGRFRLRFR